MKTIMTVLLFLAVLILPLSAFAGTVSVHDRAPGFLPPNAQAQLSADADKWPFDAHVLIENASSLDMLEDDAHTSVNGPNVVAIAIDPGHHKTVVRFGTSTGVKQGDFDSISKAGNAHFRSGNTVQGIETILLRASASKESSTAMSTSDAPVTVHVQSGLSTGTWLILATLFVGLGALSIWLYRRSKRDKEAFQSALDENRLETAELRSRNVEEMTMPRSAKSEIQARRLVTTATPPTYPVTAPVVVQQSGGSNDFAMGMIVGEELSGSRLETFIERDYVRESPSSYSSRSDDSSSSSYDSGGSSSSYDSGSSSDFGGGGFDSGGSDSSW